MEGQLTREEIRKYEQRVLDLRSTAENEVEEVEADTLEPSGDPQLQSGDWSNEEELLDDQADVLSTEDELGYAVHAALDRIRDGTYGICITCGRRISRERLDLVPYAEECALCATARESQGVPGVGSPRVPGPDRG